MIIAPYLLQQSAATLFVVQGIYQELFFSCSLDELQVNYNNERSR